jgi:hypothetical protein
MPPPWERSEGKCTPAVFRRPKVLKAVSVSLVFLQFFLRFRREFLEREFAPVLLHSGNTETRVDDEWSDCYIR